MSIIRIEKLNEVYLRIFSEPSIEQELSDFFKFRMSGYQYTPQFKNKLWDGWTRLFNIQTKCLYVGLIDYVIEFAKRNGYDCELINDVKETTDITFDEVKSFAHSLNLYGRGKPITIYDYQIDAIHTALSRNRALLISPTSSGKSLFLYVILRSHLEFNRKIIIIVPSTQLVEQLYSDFEDYSTANGFQVDNHTQKLYSGFSKLFTKDIIITTWQSVYLENKQFFNQFDVIVGDECLHPTTSITMSDGTNKSICDIEKGDMVLTINEETGAVESKSVIKLHKNISNEKMYKIKLKNGNTVMITGNHRMLSENGWKRADELFVGDKIKKHINNV